MRKIVKHTFAHMYFRIALVLFAVIFASLVVAVVGIFSYKFQDAIHGAASDTVDQEFFTDVSSDHSNAKEIYFLKRKGIVNGYSDGSFKPDAKVTRAEIIALIVKSKGARPHGLLNSHCFSDVQDQWYAKYICFAKNKGFVSGYDDGSFHPDENVDNVAAYKMLLEGFKVDLLRGSADEENESWYTVYVNTAIREGWISPGNYDSSTLEEELSRSDLAELLFKVVSSKMPLL
ncbi:S-layer homology domain-containing protein [Pseudomonadota bacterium]